MSVLAVQPELLPLPWQEPSAVDGAGMPSQGEVFTRSWVVELVLDLAGYSAERDLALTRAIEPACGTGAFLVSMVRRLSRACRAHGRSVEEAADSIFAVDLQPAHAALARTAVTKTLLDEGWGASSSTALAEAWVHVGDFILVPDLASTADFVLGNPPYVRLEDVAAERSAAYRRACPTMGGRADLFVGFYEAGLRALRPDGVLAYICADRWMHNQYGRGLRALIGAHFSVDALVVMHDVDAFEEEVSAYPAVTVIRRGEQGSALVADTTARFGAPEAKRLVRWAHGTREEAVRTEAFDVASLPGWHKGADSWPAGSPEQLALVADLEARFPLLESAATGTRVGIGVATGADGVFVTPDPGLVEEDRLLRLAMVRDTKKGTFEWSGHYLVDPWADEPVATPLVDLESHPRLRAHFEAHEERLRRRHVAGRRPSDWYRTIDRIDHTLTARPKLLFPDLKLAMEPVYEGGGHYPHHNLYYLVSDGWPLDVLGGLLLSRVADLFVRTYSVKMRGGTLRFQAQYLRRIRVPPLESISRSAMTDLSEAFGARDIERATGVAARLYGIEGGLPGAGRPASV